MIRLQDVQPERRTVMVETKHQQTYVAGLYARLGFKYIIGWKDVRGYGITAVRNIEWKDRTQSAYINLRDH